MVMCYHIIDELCTFEEIYDGDINNMNNLGLILKDRYELIAELGKGGMSSVFLAKDKNLDSYWAVKQVVNDSNVDIEAFKKEVELLSSLNHSDIPRIVDRIEVDNYFYVVMDFIDGTSLGKKVLKDGPASEDDVVEWAKMLCDVLHYLHTVKENPIIYRDMKPDNVMLTQAGRIKLIDFGIAKECRHGEKQTGESIGTKGYAAPEQYKGSSNILDERTDIYSLGATLFYLVTGNVPGKPPKACRPIRQINPMLSEGLEYIISKCTNDNPDERYQNCLEIKEDLINIKSLTGTYRNKMMKKLMSFIVSLVFCIIFLGCSFIGYNRIQSEKEANYQMEFQTAKSFDRNKNYDEAIKHYTKAIEYKGDDIDTYILLFNSLLPHQKQDDYIALTKSAIDQISKSYIDNKESDAYKNPKLMYPVMKKCIELNDPEYADIAVDYINSIKNSDEYKNNKSNFDNIDNYRIVAMNCANNISTQKFDEFNEALVNLEKSTDSAKISINDKLDNYYTIMVMYSSYPNNLKNSYNRISEVAQKAKKIIDSNLSSEELTFNNIIPMYELVASSMYNYAVVTSENKEKLYSTSIEWFEYLSDLNDDLNESLFLKKANAYKAIFDIKRDTNGTTVTDKKALDSLEKSISLYTQIISKDPTSFLGYVYLTQANFDKQINKPEGQRNYTIVMQNYKKVVELKNNTRNLPSIALSQFTSLKKQLQSVGLGE